MHKIKVCSILEIFLCRAETKEYCEQNETLDNFFTKMRLCGEFLVNEKRVCGTVHGSVCGLLSILRQGFNRLVQSCSIVRTVKYSL